MKKTPYIQPRTTVVKIQIEQMIAASITSNVAGLTSGGDADEPMSADSRRRSSIWEED